MHESLTIFYEPICIKNMFFPLTTLTMTLFFGV